MFAFLYQICHKEHAYLPTVLISSGRSRLGDPNPTSHPTTTKSRFVPTNNQNAAFNPLFSFLLFKQARIPKNNSLFFSHCFFSFFRHLCQAGSHPLVFATLCCLSVVFHFGPWRVQVLRAGRNRRWHAAIDPKHIKLTGSELARTIVQGYWLGSEERG